MQASGSSSSTPTQVTFAVDGMTCGHCVAAVKRALSSVPGVDVQQVAVGSATVLVDPQQTSVDTLVEAIRDEGYNARPN